MRDRPARRRAWAFLLLGVAVGCGGEGAPSTVPPLADRLRAAPGVTAVAVSQVQRQDGARLFQLRFAQPVDHRDPAGPTFSQAATLLVYGAEDAPLVLVTAGYALSPSATRSEPSALLGANQLTVEHRYFGSSVPSPLDWSKLDIWQAAGDLHRIAAALKPVLRGSWISTGASKGGMAALFHRRFHPGDVDATLAYVAPIMRSAQDERFPAFLASVGDATCRAALAALQRALLARRAELEPLLLAEAAAAGETLATLGVSTTWDYLAIEVAFGFWQGAGADGCASIPAPDAPAAELWAWIRALAGGSVLAYFGDAALAHYAPFFYQSATQLGWPLYPQDHLADLVPAPIEDVPARYPPAGVAKVFDPAAMADVAAWISSQGERILLVYGGDDPWSAAMVEPAAGRDAHRFVVPGGNHEARIGLLPGPDRAAATAILRRWAGLAPAAAALAAPPAASAFDPRALLRGEPGRPLDDAAPRRPRRRLGRSHAAAARTPRSRRPLDAARASR